MGLFNKGTATGVAPMSDAARARNGARWFYWIGGLSVLNSIVAFTGSTFMLVFGLASTLVATYLGINMGGTASIIGMAIAVLFGLGFVGLGWMAERGALWAFLTGIVLYALDAIASVFLQDWIGLLAHVFALTIIGMGAAAAFKASRSDSTSAPSAAPVEPYPPHAAPIAPAAPATHVIEAPTASIGFAEASAPPPLD